MHRLRAQFRPLATSLPNLSSEDCIIDTSGFDSGRDTGVLEHIEERGSLLRFAPDRPRRLELMKAISEQKLVVWNREAGKYELTALGRQCLDECREKIASERLRAIRA